MFNSYVKAWSNALLATQVVSARLPVLCCFALDPTPGGRAEMHRMIAEKQEALLDGFAGAQAVAFTAWHKFIAGRSAAVDGQALIEDYMDALTLPAERILQDNVRRLGPGA